MAVVLDLHLLLSNGVKQGVFITVTLSSRFKKTLTEFTALKYVQHSRISRLNRRRKWQFSVSLYLHHVFVTERSIAVMDSPGRCDVDASHLVRVDRVPKYQPISDRLEVIHERVL